MYQSYTSRLTELWSLPKPAQGLNTYNNNNMGGILSRQKTDMLICLSKSEVQEEDHTKIWTYFHACITFEACTKQSKSFVIFNCQEFGGANEK